MKRIGIVSYNIYCNFTNYGSALQTWALQKSIEKLGYTPVLIDYCPDVLADKNPLAPLKNMWDQDEESVLNLKLSMEQIRENYCKFDRFYNERVNKTANKYTSGNFELVVSEEHIDGFVCGSDTIFCILEFNGFDDGYFANYECMKNGYAVSYAASFGDAVFDDNSYKILEQRLGNFKALGLRENTLIDSVKKMVSVSVKRVLDPTLLLRSEDYDTIAVERMVKEKYILLYTRRYDPYIEKYVEKLVKKKHCKIVEISLRATNAEKGHLMYYKAGVEEFLSLVKYAEEVVTNSYHGLIFAVQYRRPVHIFKREQADTKIDGIVEICGLQDRIVTDINTALDTETNYTAVFEKIEAERNSSTAFLEGALKQCP